MGEVVGAITNITNVVLWLVLGVPCALLLNYLGEKHFRQGANWALWGLLFNVFAVLAYLMIIGYQASESGSTGALEVQRMRRMLEATKGIVNLNRNVMNIEDGSHITVLPTDPRIEDLLTRHQPAEALDYARERYRVAFQSGDHAREQLYDGYIQRILSEDSALKARLANLQRDTQA